MLVVFYTIYNALCYYICIAIFIISYIAIPMLLIMPCITCITLCYLQCFKIPCIITPALQYL